MDAAKLAPAVAIFLGLQSTLLAADNCQDPPRKFWHPICHCHLPPDVPVVESLPVMRVTPPVLRSELVLSRESLRLTPAPAADITTRTPQALQAPLSAPTGCSSGAPAAPVAPAGTPAAPGAAAAPATPTLEERVSALEGNMKDIKIILTSQNELLKECLLHRK